MMQAGRSMLRVRQFANKTPAIANIRTVSTSAKSLKDNQDNKGATRNASTTSASQQQAVAAAAKAEPFLSGSSSNYIESMYESWLNDPNSVHKSWDTYFRNVNSDAPPGQAHQRPPALGGDMPMVLPSLSGSTALLDDVAKHLSVQALIRGYQIRGHFMSQLDPLAIGSSSLEKIDNRLEYIYGRDLPIGMTSWCVVPNLYASYAISESEKFIDVSTFLKRLRFLCCFENKNSSSQGFETSMLLRLMLKAKRSLVY